MGIGEIKVTAPKVSIVIPLFNKSEFIIDALNSVFAQSFRDWECLIVDDGSTDGSSTLVQEFMQNNPGRWSLLTQSNMGPSSARNLGLSVAKGEYIAFLDADDFWHHKKLEHQVKFMESNPSLVLTLTQYLIFSNDSMLPMKLIAADEIDRLLSGWLSMTGFGGLVESTGMIRSRLISQDLLFDTTLKTSEGLDFVFKWRSLGQIEIVQETHTFYRMSLNQLHKDEPSVIVSMKTLADRYSSGEAREKLHRQHSSYFKLSSMRRLPLLPKLLQIVRHCFSVDGTFMIMLFKIVFRNIKAQTLAARKKGYLHQASLHLR